MGTHSLAQAKQLEVSTMKELITKSHAPEVQPTPQPSEQNVSSIITQLSYSIIEIFFQSSTLDKELLQTANLIKQNSLVYRHAIWIAHHTDQPLKTGMSKADYFQKYFEIEPKKLTREIARARIQSLLIGSILNNSCLDEFDKICRSHSTELLLTVYKSCSNRVLANKKLRITKNMIQVEFQSALEASNQQAKDEDEDEQQNVSPCVNSTQLPELPYIEEHHEEKDALPTTNIKHQQSCPAEISNDEQAQTKSLSKENTELQTKPLISPRKKSSRFQLQASKRSNKRMMLDKLNKSTFEIMQTQILKKTLKLEKKFQHINRGNKKAEKLFEEVLISRAEILLESCYTLFLLRHFINHANEFSYMLSEQTYAIDSINSLRENFIKEVRNTI